MNRKLNLLVAVFVTVAVSTSSTLPGQTTEWVGGGGNSFFSNPLNWNNGVPGPLDDALFRAESPQPVVNVLFSESINRLYVGSQVVDAAPITLSGAVKIDVQENLSTTSAELNLINQISVTCDRFDVNGGGEFNILDATVSTNSVNVGNVASVGTMTISGGSVVSVGGQSSRITSGTVTVSDSGSQWVLVGNLTFALSTSPEDAILNIQEGGFVSARRFRIGASGTQNSIINVDGNQSELFCEREMEIGFGSIGELNISNFGCATVLDDLIIDSGSMVTLRGNGTLQVAEPIFNHGVMIFTGPGFVDGDLVNPTGTLEVGTNGVANIAGDLTHNGPDLSVAAGGQLLVCGNWSGSGHFTGGGRVDLEAGVSPGNSSSDNIVTVLFGGDLNLGADTQSDFQLADELSHDQLSVDGDLSIDGGLMVNPILGFQLEPDMQFGIIFVGGSVSGTFDGLPEGALVGNFNGVDLFITYSGGDGNDVVLITSSAFVLGDANDDSAFNNLDIAAFVLALTNPVAYQAMFPGVDPDVVLDMNGDGGFDNLDIAGFVAALTGP